MKIIKNNSGLTLIELLISIVLLSILLTAFTSAYTMGINVYKRELKNTVLQNENRILLDRIITDIKQANAIDPSSTSENLIIMTPGLDINGEVFMNVLGQFESDTITYQKSGNQLLKITVPDASSSRTASSKTIAENLYALTLTYIPNLASVTEIEVNLQTIDTFAGKNIIINNTSRAKLRNK